MPGFIQSILGFPASPLASDEQSMWRVQMHDDHEAFTRLVARWQLPIRRLCIRMTGDFHHAEDLTQEAFSRLFAHRKDYKPSGRFSTFLWRIALNLCLDELRRRQRHPNAATLPRAHSPGDIDEDKPLPDTVTPAPDDSLLQEERAELVRRALLELPELYRSVVVLRHYEGLKFAEIADVLGIPEGTAKSRMAEALSQLHGRLAPVLERTTSPSRTPSHPSPRLNL